MTEGCGITEWGCLSSSSEEISMISLAGGSVGFLDRERTCVLSFLAFFDITLRDFDVSVSEDVRDIVSIS